MYKITKSRDTEKPTLDIKTASEDPNQPAHTRSINGILTVRKETFFFQEFSRINHMYAYTYGQFCNFGQLRIFHKYDGNMCERYVRICHTCVNFTGMTNTCTFISVTCVKIALLLFHRGYLIFSHLMFIR